MEVEIVTFVIEESAQLTAPSSSKNDLMDILCLFWHNHFQEGLEIICSKFSELSSINFPRKQGIQNVPICL